MLIGWTLVHRIKCHRCVSFVKQSLHYLHLGFGSHCTKFQELPVAQVTPERGWLLSGWHLWFLLDSPKAESSHSPLICSKGDTEELCVIREGNAWGFLHRSSSVLFHASLVQEDLWTWAGAPFCCCSACLMGALGSALQESAVGDWRKLWWKVPIQNLTVEVHLTREMFVPRIHETCWTLWVGCWEDDFQRGTCQTWHMKSSFEMNSIWREWLSDSWLQMWSWNIFSVVATAVCSVEKVIAGQVNGIWTAEVPHSRQEMESIVARSKTQRFPTLWLQRGSSWHGESQVTWIHSSLELKFAEDFAYSHGLIDDHFYKVYKDKAAHCVSLIEAGFKQQIPQSLIGTVQKFALQFWPREGGFQLAILSSTSSIRRRPPECLVNLHQGGQLKEAEKFCEDSVRNLYASNTMQQSLLDTLGGTDLEWWIMLDSWSQCCCPLPPNSPDIFGLEKREVQGEGEGKRVLRRVLRREEETSKLF